MPPLSYIMQKFRWHLTIFRNVKALNFASLTGRKDCLYVIQVDMEALQGFLLLVTIMIFPN